MKFREVKQNLLEARADYFTLFNPLIAIVKKHNLEANIEDIIKAKINAARQKTGTRYNYMMYYLKMVRGFLASHFIARVSDVEDRKTLTKMMDTAPKYQKTDRGVPTRSNLDKILTDFQHFLSYGYKPIEDYIPAKAYFDVLDDLGDLETKYQEQNETDDTRFLQLQDGDKIFKEYPDGFVWVMLNRHSCRQEANAMGHCGNSGGNYTDRILSLRKKEVRNGETYYIPYLTFIYNPETKLLGERKARYNEKPAKRYHPYILDLLRMDMVQGMEPEDTQYAPENNFQYDDLSPEQREQLFKNKPILSVTDGAKLSEFSDDMKEVIVSRINSEVGHGQIFYDKEKNKIFVTIYTESVMDDRLIKFVSDVHRYSDFGYLYSNDYLQNFSSLNIKNTEILYKAFKKVYDDSDHDKEDYEDFPEFAEFNRSVSRGGLVDLLEEVGLDDSNSDIDEIFSNLYSLLSYQAEREYEDYILSQLVKKMPDLDGDNYTLTFAGFADKNYRDTKEMYQYFSEETYFAVYETDRLVTSSDTIENIVGNTDKLDSGDLDDNRWYPEFSDLNEVFENYFEFEVKED
jgi:hypothetical protein